MTKIKPMIRPTRKMPYLRKNIKIKRLERIDYQEYVGHEATDLKSVLTTVDMLYTKRCSPDLYVRHVPNTRKVELCFVNSDSYEHIVLDLEEA